MRALQKLKWKAFYGFMAWRFPVPEWVFMNYGYERPEGPLELPPEDEKDRWFVQLYAEALNQGGPVRGRDVLEVGCGRGGGISWVDRTQVPRSTSAVDLSSNAVRFCKERHAETSVAFRQGDAECLPFQDESFDVVLNVESCHHYPSLEAFLSEVERVLRPGGTFRVTTYWDADEVERFRETLAQGPLRLVSETDLTGGVAKALDASEEAKRTLIERHGPWYLRPLLRFFAASDGTGINQGLREGRIHYVACLLEKPLPAPAVQSA